MYENRYMWLCIYIHINIILDVYERYVSMKLDTYKRLV